MPDGVAKVRFVFPRQPFPAQPGAPTYAHSLTMVAPVHGNVAAVQVDRDVAIGAFAMIWYGPSGQIVKRVGDLAAVNFVGLAHRSTRNAGRSPARLCPRISRSAATRRTCVLA